MIKAENVTFEYDRLDEEGNIESKLTAVDHLSLKIESGSFIAVLGHNGSGKSTLTQHLNGLTKATSGKIYFNGKDIYGENFSMKELRSKVGLVFQYPEHQLFEIDVLTDVCFGPKNLGCSKEEAEERAKKALRMVGMGEEYDKCSPFELSGEKSTGGHAYGRAFRGV